MSRKKKYEKKAFESIGTNSDTFASIYNSMIMSDAFNALTKNQRLLYLYMKIQRYTQKRKPHNNETMFYFNRFLYCDKYHLYNKNGTKQFYKDRDALIEKGFIKVIDDGSTTRTKNVYQFTDRWQKYGTSDFKLDYNDMSSSLRKKKRKK